MNSIVIYNPKAAAAGPRNQPGPALQRPMELRPTAGQRLLGDLAASGVQLAQLAAKEARESKELHDVTDVVSAANEFHRGMLAFEDEYRTTRQGADARDALGDFERQARTLHGDLRKRFAGNDRMLLAFDQAVDGMGRSAMERGAAYGRQQDAEYRRSTLLGARATFQQFAAGNQGNPAAVRAQRAILDDMARSLMPGQDNTALFAAWDRDDTKQAIATALSEKTPDGVSRAHSLYEKSLALLGDDAPAVLNQIDAREESIMRRRLMDDERRTRLADRAERRAAAEADKTLTDKLYAGTLTGDDVEKARPLLTGDDYREWRKRAVEGPAQTNRDDPATYLDLVESADRGEDISTAARSAYRNGRIRKETFDSLTARRDDNETKFFRDSISLSLRPSDFNPDPAQAASHANALMDFDEWDRKNPQATYQNRQEAAQGVIRRYSMVDPSQNPLTLPMPRFFSGARSDINAQTLDAAEDATADTFEAGRITNEELEQESRRISNMRSALERQAQLRGK